MSTTKQTTPLSTTQTTPSMERETLQLTRDLSQVWDNPKFHAADHKPAIALASAKPLITYAVTKILELRKKKNVSPEEIPLTGRAKEYLMEELSKGRADDIVGFIKQLIAHALQTGDGDFPQGVTISDIDTIIKTDPPVFSSEKALAEARQVSDKIEQLLESFQPLHHTLAEFSEILTITRKLRNVEFRLTEATKSREEARRTALRTGATPQEPTAASTELRRTQSQQGARVQVEKVRSHLLEKMTPMAELRRTLSLVGPEESRNRRRRMMRNMRKRGRDFHEDLMNLLFSLDDLKVGEESERLFRRDTVEKVQDMLDELDSISTQMDAIQLKQPTESKQQAVTTGATPQTAVPLPSKAAPTPSPLQPTTQQPIERVPETPGQVAVPTDVKKIDWKALKLPLRFDSRITPQAYLLLASLSGLDTKTLKLTVASDENSLRVEGFRAPDDTERKKLEETGDVFKALAAAQGKYGTFKEDFQLPSDSQTAEIYAEYNRGIVRVVIPRSMLPRPVESLFGVPSDFFEGEFWW